MYYIVIERNKLLQTSICVLIYANKETSSQQYFALKMYTFLHSPYSLFPSFEYNNRSFCLFVLADEKQPIIYRPNHDVILCTYTPYRHRTYPHVRTPTYVHPMTSAPASLLNYVTLLLLLVFWTIVYPNSYIPLLLSC